MKVTVNASTHTLIRFWLVPGGLVLAAYALYSARTALIILGTSLFLALALNAPVSKLAKVMPGNSRGLSTAIAYVLVVLFLGAFIFLAVPPIIQQTAKTVEVIPQFVETARTQWHGVSHLINEYNLQPQVDKAVESIQGSSARWASNVGANVIGGIGSVFGFITATILVLVLSFFMLIEGPGLMRKVWGLYTDSEKRDLHHNIVHRMNAVVSGYVTGQLSVSGLGAVAAGLTVFILSFFFNLPSNLAIPAAAVTFILSLIPMFGATIGGILITALLAINDVGAAVAYVVFFVVYQQIENNYISPIIQSKRLELSALTILASVTIGVYLFGIAGGIISIPIAGCIKVLLDTYIEGVQKQSDKSTSRLEKLAKVVKKEA